MSISWCPHAHGTLIARVALQWGKCPRCGYTTPERAAQDARPKKWHRKVRRPRQPKPVCVIETQDGRPLVSEYRCPVCKGHKHNCELCNGRGVVSRLRLGMHQGWIMRAP